MLLLNTYSVVILLSDVFLKLIVIFHINIIILVKALLICFQKFATLLLIVIFYNTNSFDFIFKQCKKHPLTLHFQS